MLGIARVRSDQVSESISWVKVNSKWLQISPESTIEKVFLTSYMGVFGSQRWCRVVVAGE